MTCFLFGAMPLPGPIMTRSVTAGNPETYSDSDSDKGLFNMKLHTKVYIRFTLQNNTNILNKYEPGIVKNTCWETSTKIIADRFCRGHPEGGGVLRSVVGI